MSLTIEPLQPTDLDDALVPLAAAFGGPRSLRESLTHGLALQPDGWLLARLDGVVVGTVGAIDYGPFAYIGLMAVHPHCQQRGIGLALMQAMLAWLDGRGCPIALLDATAAGIPLYLKVGFEADGQSFRFQRPEHTPDPDLPPQVRLFQPSDLEAVIAFDTPIFGANRAVVVRSYLQQYPERAFVTHDQAGQLSGYLIAQPQNIGPWVAQTPADAQRLLHAALTLPYDNLPGVIVPPGNPTAAAALFARFGFERQRTVTHMWRGAPDPRDCSRMYGQASFMLG
jgi:predicted N-acetyltransferase YhbS